MYFLAVSLFALSFCTLRARERNARKDAGLKGIGQSRLATVTAQGYRYHVVEKPRVFHTERLPKIEGERSGNGVDLVEEDLAGGRIEKKIDSRHTAATESLECIHGGLSDVISLLGSDGRRDLALKTRHTLVVLA